MYWSESWEAPGWQQQTLHCIPPHQQTLSKQLLADCPLESQNYLPLAPGSATKNRTTQTQQLITK